MGRTKQTARKCAGGRRETFRLPSAGEIGRSLFTSELGMPTLLWRVMAALGYGAGQEPRYSWVEQERADLEGEPMDRVRVEIPPLQGSEVFVGFYLHGKGSNPWFAANRAAYKALERMLLVGRDQVLAAYPGVFPRTDYHELFWPQPAGRALLGGDSELSESESPAMSAVFALMMEISGLEFGYTWYQQELRRQVYLREREQTEHQEEVQRLLDQIQELEEERDGARRQRDELRMRVSDLEDNLADLTQDLERLTLEGTTQVEQMEVDQVTIQGLVRARDDAYAWAAVFQAQRDQAVHRGDYHHHWSELWLQHYLQALHDLEHREAVIMDHLDTIAQLDAQLHPDPGAAELGEVVQDGLMDEQLSDYDDDTASEDEPAAAPAAPDDPMDEDAPAPPPQQ